MTAASGAVGTATSRGSAAGSAAGSVGTVAAGGGTVGGRPAREMTSNSVSGVGIGLPEMNENTASQRCWYSRIVRTLPADGTGTTSISAGSRAARG